MKHKMSAKTENVLKIFSMWNDMLLGLDKIMPQNRIFLVLDELDKHLNIEADDGNAFEAFIYAYKSDIEEKLVEAVVKEEYLMAGQYVAIIRHIQREHSFGHSTL